MKRYLDLVLLAFWLGTFVYDTWTNRPLPYVLLDYAMLAFTAYFWNKERK